jgi:pimeloyl-ACP methyl ester carboxylesterase
MTGPGAFEPKAEWIHISYAETQQMRDVYGFAASQGRVHLEGVRFSPKHSSKTLLVYMHPASTLQLLPVPRAMAQAGVHVLCGGSRYARNDTPLIMENVLRDLAAYIRHAREEWDYEKIVIAGWSGGGSLSAFYQGQAERPSVMETPAGDDVDLSCLIPADGLIFQAAHLSRAEVLAEFIDPSVLDEIDPTLRDASPNASSYGIGKGSATLVAERQNIRGRTGLAHPQDSGGPAFSRRQYRSECPNDRRVGWCFLGDPESSNNSPAGIARYSTMRAWLSQWSIDDTNARALMNAPSIHVPVLVIENSADDAVPQPHTRQFFDAAGSAHKRFLRIEKADHYYTNQPKQLREATDAILLWLQDNRLLA